MTTLPTSHVLFLILFAAVGIETTVRVLFGNVRIVRKARK